MDPLDPFLDRICRGVGGSRELRQHLRQELREHLLDAAAEHRAAGMTEAEALDKALADFGGPEEVRTELEATYGHRLLPVLLDKAMQWKEKTMKAKWLWTTWATLALVAVVVIDLLFIGFTVRFQLPKLQKLTAEGWLRFDDRSEPGVSWMYSFMANVRSFWDGIVWVLLLLVAGWGLFEWRARGENKTFIRLSGLGTLAVLLTVVVVVLATCSVIPFGLGLPGSQIARPWAVEAITGIETSVTGIEEAVAKKDWDVVQGRLDRAEQGLTRLDAGPAPGALATWNKPPSGPEIRAYLDAAKAGLANARAAARDRDAARVEAALRTFRDAFGPILASAKRADR